MSCFSCYRRGGAEVERSLRVREIRVRSRQTLVVKTGNDNSTAILSAIGVSVTGPRRCPLLTASPFHSRGGMLKNPHCSMTTNAEQRSKFAAFTGN